MTMNDYDDAKAFAEKGWSMKTGPKGGPADHWTRPELVAHVVVRPRHG